MRKDNRDRFVEELLDAALTNQHIAEPRVGLEERVLANLRQQPRIARAARTVSRNSAPVMIVAIAVLSLFAVDHLMNHQVLSDPTVTMSGGNEPRADVEPKLTGRRAKAVEEAVASLPAKRVKAAPKPAPSSSHRQDLAISLNSHRADERANSGLRVEEVRIAEVRLDDIVISSNERHD